MHRRENWNGSRIHKDGRLMTKCLDHPKANCDGYIFNSRLVAEKVLGYPLPLKVVVHHVKTIDDDLSIVICENNVYHMILHARKRIVDAGGNPNTHKLCCTCKLLKSHSEFTRCNSHWDKLQANCKECQRRPHERSNQSS
jgi:hypothetical protein